MLRLLYTDVYYLFDRQKRKQERLELNRQQAAREDEAARLQTTIKSRLLVWADNPAINRRRPLFELLNSVHGLCSALSLQPPSPPLTNLSPPTEVRPQI